MGGGGEPVLEPQAMNGVRKITLDTRGRLMEFNAAPPEFALPASSGEPDWSPVFAALNLIFPDSRRRNRNGRLPRHRMFALHGRG